MQITMINRHLIKDDTEEAGVEKLLEPSRVTIQYENLIKDNGNNTWMNIDMLVEPFEFKVGFREIEFFNKLSQNVLDFQKAITDPEDLNMTLETEVDIDKELKRARNKELLELALNSTNDNGQRVQIKKEEQINVMTVKFRCETFRFSLMDDTGLQEYPVIFMNVRNVKLDHKKYEDIDDAAVFILKKMGIMKKKNDEEEPYINTHASLNIEVFYFNMNVQAYEPVLEPWDVQFSQYQEERYTSQKSKISSGNILNMNVTFALMHALTNIQQRLAQTSEDWEEEVVIKPRETKTLIQKESISVKKNNYGIQTTMGLTNSVLSDNNEDQSGFIFINRLSMPIEFYVEGQLIHDMKMQLINGLIGGKQTNNNEEFKQEDFEEQLRHIEDGDPKAHFKKLALYRKLYTRRKTQQGQIEKIIQLDKDGAGMKKFRKSDELYYLMKQIKQQFFPYQLCRGKTNTKSVSTYEDEILRIDLQIEGQKKIKGIPIELGGVRSFLLECKYDQKPIESEFQMIQPTAKTVVETPIAVICKIQFENQTKKEVEFQSSLLFSNCSEQTIILYGYKQSAKTKTIKGEQPLIMEDNAVPLEKRIEIPPNKLFYVPLTWFIKRKSIYVKQKDQNFHLLFPDLREHFNPKLTQYKHIESKILEFENEDSSNLKETRYVACNISLFKCKPTTLNVPGQYLVTFTPHISVCNYLFSDLELLTNRGQTFLGQAEPKNYFYLNNVKFEKLDREFSASQLVQWRFRDAEGNFYMSEEIPFFNTAQKITYKNQIQNPTNFIRFKNHNSFRISGSQINLEDDVEYSEECLLNFELTPFNLINNEYDNFELRDKIFEKTSAVTLYLYPQAMIVNQTNVDIFIKTVADHNKQRTICIKAHNNEFFYSQSNKAQLKVQNYQWSRQFDVTTLGLTGSIEIKAAIDQPSKILNFGVIIENGMNQFSKTKIIKIVPRYIVYNNLDDPIIIRQKNQDKQQLILPKDKQVYNFQNKEKDSFLQIRDMDKHTEQYDKVSDKLTLDETLWSSPFSIEDVEDFQVEFSSSFFKQEKRYEDNRIMAVFFQGGTQKKRQAWHLPNDNNGQKRFVRVSINTQDDATIFVIISKPKFPEYYIYNNTDVPIGYTQLKTNQQFNILKFDRNEPRVIKPGQKVPFVWKDQTMALKKINFHIDGKQQSYSIDKIKKFKKQFVTNVDSYFVEVLTTGDVRTVEVRSQTVEQRRLAEREKGSSQLARLFLSQFLKKGSMFTLDFKGFGLSLIDNEPKEIIYMSVYKLNFVIEKWAEQSKKDQNNYDQVTELITKYDLKIDHIQIDNVLNDVMPVFFCPTKELIKDDSHSLIAQSEDYTPFIQVMITYSEIQDKDIYIKKYQGLQIQVQEMKLEVETGLVNALLKFMFQMQSVSNKNAQFLSGYTYQQHKTMSQSRQLSGQILKSRESQCPSLIAELPKEPDMAQVTAKKIYFEFINLGAIKEKITVRFERKAFELKIDDPMQGFGFGSIFYTLFTTVATISESPLTFKEVILMHTFTSQQNLISMLTRNYARQGILQFYKFIGSSDLLGNPVGLIDKLGTGVFEFFNEPRKGLVKGPKEFVGGVGKGVKSLVTNIVSGSFDSVSKITGSLYGVVKNVSGNQINDQSLKKPEHAFDGVYQGLKGGAGEIVSGITGIFTKPYQKARDEGAKGFVKGLGSGLLGAVASPFAATLRLGNNISTGIKNSAIKLQKGKLPTYGRFRHPRYFNSKSILEPYVEAFAEANQILRTLNNGYYATQTIKFFADFTSRKGKTTINGVLIITDSTLLYVEDLKNLKYYCNLLHISKCEVYQETLSIQSARKQGRDIMPQSNPNASPEQMFKYHLVVDSKKRGNLKLENENYPLIDKVYTILSP